jgi:hypothetical protein
MAVNTTYATITFSQTPPVPNYAGGQCASQFATYWYVNNFYANVTGGSNLTLAVSSVNVTNVPCPRPVLTNAVAVNNTRSYNWTLTAGTPSVANLTGVPNITWPITIAASLVGGVNASMVTGNCTVRGYVGRSVNITDIDVAAVGGNCSKPVCNLLSLTGFSQVARCTYLCNITVTSASCLPTFTTLSGPGNSVATTERFNVTAAQSVALLNDTSGCLKLVSALMKATATTPPWTEKTYCAGTNLSSTLTITQYANRGTPLSTACPQFGIGNYTLVNDVALLTTANGTNSTWLATNASLTIPCPNVTVTGDASASTVQNWTWWEGGGGGEEGGAGVGG